MAQNEDQRHTEIPNTKVVKRNEVQNKNNRTQKLKNKNKDNRTLKGISKRDKKNCREEIIVKEKIDKDVQC